MQKNFKLGVIGAGFMSTAIVSGVLRSGFIGKHEIIVSDISEDRLVNVKELGVFTTTDNLFLANNSEFVLFAVKPQNFSDICAQISSSTCKKFISIMAGVKIDKIKASFKDVQIARCMPNTPCSIGCGAIGLDVSSFTSENDKNFIINVLKPCGEIILTQEKHLNIVTGISGSAPAYFYYFVRSLIKAGVQGGLSFEDAKTLAVATMIGSGKMINNNQEKSLDELISAVCSKGGTTIEAIKVFDEQNFEKVVKDAVDACVKRAKELENL